MLNTQKELVVKPTDQFIEQYPIGKKFKVVDDNGLHCFFVGDVVEVKGYDSKYCSFVGLYCRRISDGIWQVMEPAELEEI
jgi:hypothetical protein